MLTNVKTRGVFGEVQLAALLEQVFTPEQYAVNVATVPGSSERVEFAIRLPGQRHDGAPLWLPIDAKFPREDYERFNVADIASKASALPFAKLDWLNGVYIRQMDAEPLKQALAPYLAGALGLEAAALLTDPRLDALIPLIRERIKLLTEAAPLVDWAFLAADAITYPNPALLVGKKLTAAQSVDVLRAGLVA